MFKNGQNWRIILFLGLFVSTFHLVQALIECPICRSEFAEDQMVKYPCNHRICTECFKETFSNQVEVQEQVVDIEGFHQVIYRITQHNYKQCPFCREQLSDETEEALLGDLDILFRAWFNYQTAVQFIEDHPHEHDNPEEINDLQLKCTLLQSRYEMLEKRPRGIGKLPQLKSVERQPRTVEAKAPERDLRVHDHSPCRQLLGTLFCFGGLILVNMFAWRMGWW